MPSRRAMHSKKKTNNFINKLPFIAGITLILGIIALFSFTEQDSTIKESSKKDTINEKEDQMVQENEKTDNTGLDLETDKEVEETTKEIEIYTEDKKQENKDTLRFNIETEQATLKTTQNASVYLLDGYSSKENNGNTIISLESNNKVYATMKKISSDFDVSDYLSTLQSSMNASTAVLEKNPNYLPNDPLQNAKLYVLVSHAITTPISNVSHIIDKVDGQLYKYEIHTFATEEEERIISEFLSMFSTVIAN